MEGGGRRDQEIFSRSLGSVQLDRHPEEEPRVTAEGLPKCPALLDLLLANASCVWSLSSSLPSSRRSSQFSEYFLAHGRCSINVR